MKLFLKQTGKESNFEVLYTYSICLVFLLPWEASHIVSLSSLFLSNNCIDWYPSDDNHCRKLSAAAA